MQKADRETTRRELIDTYTFLNNEIRGKDEESLASGRGHTSVKEIIRQMRDDELLFAKALTERLTGDTLGAPGDEDEMPLIGNEVDDASTAILISQFGSARATTLNTMASAQEADWDRPLSEDKTMLDLARSLAESDRQNIEKIRSAVGA
ncbi:hypothetical protein BH20CHL2_BH20CHL2_13000 [soil metagenome]